MKMLEAHNLAKSYAKRPVVKDVSLTVKQGEIVGFTGAQWRRQDHLFLYADRPD